MPPMPVRNPASSPGLGVNDPLHRLAPAQGQLLTYAAGDQRAKIDLHLPVETARPTQAHVADPLQATLPNLAKRLRNLFAQGELQPEGTIQEPLTVRQEGSRKGMGPNPTSLTCCNKSAPNRNPHRRTRDLVLLRLLPDQVSLEEY